MNGSVLAPTFGYNPWSGPAALMSQAPVLKVVRQIADVHAIRRVKIAQRPHNGIDAVPIINDELMHVFV
jgi:hypothetical protein